MILIALRLNIEGMVNKMKKIDKMLKSYGSTSDIYELWRFASYVLEYKDNFDEIFKVNYRDIDKNITIINTNCRINNSENVTNTFIKNKSNKYAVFINDYDKINNTISIKWLNRNCGALFKWKEKSSHDKEEA